MEPIATPETLQQIPQPVQMLHEYCGKLGKHVVIEDEWTDSENIASVYVDGVIIASHSSYQNN